MLSMGGILGNFEFPKTKKFLIPEDLIEFNYWDSVHARRALEEADLKIVESTKIPKE